MFFSCRLFNDGFSVDNYIKANVTGIDEWRFSKYFCLLYNLDRPGKTSNKFLG